MDVLAGVMMDIDEPAPKVIPEPWYCPDCKGYVGRVHPDGSLQLGSVRTPYAVLVCPCGYIINWRRSDLKLSQLIKRLKKGLTNQAEFAIL